MNTKIKLNENMRQKLRKEVKYEIMKNEENLRIAFKLVKFNFFQKMKQNRFLDELHQPIWNLSYLDH